jgi:hypothetical protein
VPVLQVQLVLKRRVPGSVHVEAEKSKLTEKGLFVLKKIFSYLFEPLDSECYQTAAMRKPASLALDIFSS